MKPEVIAVTTDFSKVSALLGAKDETEYGLYQETKMGKYYARFLHDGTFSPKVVRLVSEEQAAILEAKAIASIRKTAQQIQGIISSAPVLNTKVFEDIDRKVKAKAEEIGANVKRTLENAGFNPVYSSNN